MSTHIVVGVAKNVRVVNATSGKEVAHPVSDLRDDEKLEIDLEVGEVLQGSTFRSVQKGDKIRIMTGSRRFTVSIFRKSLMESPAIYFLCWDAEHGPRLNYFYPFFGLKNLAVSESKLDEVKIIINRVKDAER